MSPEPSKPMSGKADAALSRSMSSTPPDKAEDVGPKSLPRSSLSRERKSAIRGAGDDVRLQCRALQCRTVFDA